jgi:hypothetical protein
MGSLLQTITTNQRIINSNTAAISDLQTDKQNVLIAGNNISIVNNAYLQQEKEVQQIQLLLIIYKHK